MRRIALVVIMAALPFFAFAQLSYDEKLADAMNRAEWFELEEIYNGAPKDSISEFMEIYSRCLIGNRLNRPDVSIPAFTELFSTQSQILDVGNLTSSAIMFAMDLSRIGENEQAGKLVTSVMEAVETYLDTASLDLLKQFADCYSAFSAYSPYKIDFEDNLSGVIPFRIERAGPEEKQSVLLHLENSTINGIEANITFDTGAGVNIITDSLAAQYGLIPLDATLTAKGMGYETGHYAMAKELKIGNITVYDVPFLVLSMSSNNAEADKYFSAFSITVGGELMLQLKDLTFDFWNNEITVPAIAPSRSGEKPNMCFSSGMNFLAKTVIQDTPVTMCIDTGDASYGYLGSQFFEQNEDYILHHSTKDTIRCAGIGGVNIRESYSTSDMKLTLGGNSVTVPVLDVIANDEGLLSGYENNLGIKSLMLFSKVRFNMVDFILTTYE